MAHAFPPEEIEGRLTAQRRVLQWLLTRAVRSPGELDALLEALDEPFPPADHQEDPGAVPTGAFAQMAAATAEMRLLLEPVKTACGTVHGIGRQDGGSVGRGTESDTRSRTDIAAASEPAKEGRAPHGQDGRRPPHRDHGD